MNFTGLNHFLFDTPLNVSPLPFLAPTVQKDANDSPLPPVLQLNAPEEKSTKEEEHPQRFALKNQPNPYQRKCYPYETRCLLPNPLLVLDTNINSLGALDKLTSGF